MNIVDLHQEDPQVQHEQNKLNNSLSRELTLKECAGKQQRTPSNKKPGNNVYIMRRKTKEDLSTRNDLLSNTHISS